MRARVRLEPLTFQSKQGFGVEGLASRFGGILYFFPTRKTITALQLYYEDAKGYPLLKDSEYMGIIKGISVFPPLPFSCIVLRLFSPPCSSFLPAWLRSTVLSEKEQSLSGPQAVRQPIRTGDGFRVLGLGPESPISLN